MIEFVASEAYTQNRFLGLHFGTLIDNAVRVNDFECRFDFEAGVVEARLTREAKRLCVIKRSNGRLLPFTGLLEGDGFSIEVATKRLATTLTIALIFDGERSLEEFGIGRSHSAFSAFQNAMQITTDLWAKEVKVRASAEKTDAAIVIAAILAKFYGKWLRTDSS